MNLPVKHSGQTGGEIGRLHTSEPIEPPVPLSEPSAADEPPRKPSPREMALGQAQLQLISIVGLSYLFVWLMFGVKEPSAYRVLSACWVALVIGYLASRIWVNIETIRDHE